MKNHQNYGVQYYPTPSNLIYKLLDEKRLGKPLSSFQSVLDPCAGDGQIAKHIKSSSRYNGQIQIDVCEIDEDLRVLLREKDFRIVAHDFMTYGDEYLYDLIAMNPPFSQGAEMVCHAWDILDHGVVAAIVNLRTVTHPSDRYQQRLSQLIETFGEWEEVQGAFKNAPRKTNVAVALVWLHKPESASSIHFDASKFEQESHVEVDNFGANEIMSANALQAAVESYRAAKNAIVEREKVTRKLEHYMSVPGLDRDLVGRDSVNAQIIKLRLNFWNWVFRQTNIAAFVTTKVRKKFDAMNSQNASLAFSVENIKHVLNEFMRMRGDIMNECIVEIFEEFTAYAHRADYKDNKVGEAWLTNDSYRINEKLVSFKGFTYDNRYEWNEWSINYSTIDFWADVDRALCFANGMDYTLLEVTTQDAIREHIDRVKAGDRPFSEKFYSNFFECRIYKKGTIHVKFRDPEHCQMFNWRAAEAMGWTNGLPFQPWNPQREKKKAKRGGGENYVKPGQKRYA